MSEELVFIDYRRAVPENWGRFYSTWRGVYHFREERNGLFEKRAVCGVSARRWHVPRRGFRCFVTVHDSVARELMLCTGCENALARWRHAMITEQDKQKPYRPAMARYAVLATPMLTAWRYEQRQLEEWILANPYLWDSIKPSGTEGVKSIG